MTGGEEIAASIVAAARIIAAAIDRHGSAWSARSAQAADTNTQENQK